MQTINRTEATAKKLTELFTENTGKHFLDSGGAYGRHWERNQGMTAEIFTALPSATWSRDWGTTLNAWRYCYDRLSYTKLSEVLTRLMNVWESIDYDNRNPWSCSDQEQFIESLGGEVKNGWNTYNWENMLGQTLQGYDFELHGVRMVLLQVHGGCDVRGGYTRPAIFEPCCEYWLHESDSVSLSCKTCNSEEGIWDYRSGDLIDYFGDFRSREEANKLFETGCLNCNGDLVADASHCCDW